MNKTLNINFYQNTAKLFYAVAAADNVVRKEEFDILKKLVQEEWLTIEDSRDNYNTDAAYQLEIVFDWLQSQELDSEKCYKEFISYMNNHPYFFTENINDLIIKTAGKIAASFRGTNKAELIILAKLDMALKQLKN